MRPVPKSARSSAGARARATAAHRRSNRSLHTLQAKPQHVRGNDARRLFILAYEEDLIEKAAEDRRFVAHELVQILIHYQLRRTLEVGGFRLRRVLRECGDSPPPRGEVVYEGLHRVL
jgi:hypothetical protein